MASMRQRGEEKQGAAPKVVLLCGGGSGCVSNIIADRLMSKVGKYKLIVAGRTPMQPREGKDVPFVKFDIFQKIAPLCKKARPIQCTILNLH